ncbi:hypothetical protein BV20DRAFT_959587 [Pilatotrama ljubarskyi]|nr:hypothetical protein BV20DRAFT_959587 [Pilatotrama ljubarskyi]
MAPRHHNMGWRKPVPKLSPEPSTSSARPSRLPVPRLPSAIVNKDMPPLPTDWRESIETALKREKRYAVYLSPPPSPLPQDDADSGSKSLVLTLVEQQDVVSLEPPHDDIQPIQCVQRTPASPALARRLSQKSLPRIYRPPTPPLPAHNPKLRATARCYGGSEESITTTLHNGSMHGERQRATSSPDIFPEKAPDASRKADLQKVKRPYGLASAGNELPGKPAAGGCPRTYQVSATSMSTGSRSSCGRSYLASDACLGVWYALKGWGLHVRAKMSHAGRY